VENIDIVAGSGGADTESGATGDGGSIYLTPRGPGPSPDSGNGGGSRAEGVIELYSNGADSPNQLDVVVSSIGAAVVRMFKLPTSMDSPTCSAVARDRGQSPYPRVT